MWQKRWSISMLSWVTAGLVVSSAAIVSAKADPAGAAESSSVQIAKDGDAKDSAASAQPAKNGGAKYSAASAQTAKDGDTKGSAAPPTAGAGSDGQDPPTIGQLVSDGTLGFELTGDGVRSTRSQIKLTNKTNKAVTVLIPVFQTYMSSDPRFDNVLSTEEKVITIPASGSESLTMQTMCMSTRLQRTPPATPIEYKPTAHPNQQVFTSICAIVERAKQLGERGEYEAMKLPNSWNDQTIAQMAIWKFTGIQTSTKADDITAKGVAEDMCSAMGIPRKSLNAEQRKSLDQRVSSIISAVDLTLKVLDESD